MRRMRVCVLMPVFDAFKGANHLPLFAAMPDVQFVVLTNRTKPERPLLPPNVSVTRVAARLGPYYYGIADHRFAAAAMRTYPPSSPFWRQFDVLHLNQTMGLTLLRLQCTGSSMLYLVHHPVTVDREVAVKESGILEGMHWRTK